MGSSPDTFIAEMRKSGDPTDQELLVRWQEMYAWVPLDGRVNYSYDDAVPDVVTQRMFDENVPVPLKRNVTCTDTPVMELDEETRAALEETYGTLPKGSVLRTVRYESGNTSERVISEGFALPAKVGGQASKPRAGAPKTNGQ